MPYFLGKIKQNYFRTLSAAIVTGTLRVKINDLLKYYCSRDMDIHINLYWLHHVKWYLQGMHGDVTAWISSYASEWQDLNLLTEAQNIAEILKNDKLP